MPILKSAIKKMRKDHKRTKLNRAFMDKMRKSIKTVGTQKNAEKIREVISIVDKAVKKNLLKKNTASRIKSRLSKAAKTVVPQNKEVKKTIKKTKSKK